jgi:hypothetical protein
MSGKKGDRSLDEQIEGLFKQNLLSEAEIKAMCEKAKEILQQESNVT